MKKIVDMGVDMENTNVQPVFNPFSQFLPQLELYSQLQLSLWSDSIAQSVPKSTYWVLILETQLNPK